MRFRQIRRFLSLVAVALVLGTPSANAEPLINAKKDQIAVKGYDVVAYFKAGKPTRGSADHEHKWQDVRWQFSSEQNKAAFASDPARYAPRYGGFCAGGMALGRRAPIDPEAFVIVDGKLYLNYDKATADEFGATAEQSIARADANWQKITESR